MIFSLTIFAKNDKNFQLDYSGFEKNKKNFLI